MESIFKQSCTLNPNTATARFIQVEVFRPSHDEQESVIPNFVHYLASVPGDTDFIADDGYDSWEDFHLAPIAMRSAIQWYDDAVGGRLPVFVAEEVATQ